MKTFEIVVKLSVEANSLGDAVSRVEKANTKSSSREEPGGSWVEKLVSAEEHRR